MQLTTQRETIDYDAIYTGLLNHVHRYSVIDIERMGNPGIEQELREFKTIGITAPRQCGKTQWIIKMLNEDPDSSAVFSNIVFLEKASQCMPNVAKSRLFTSWDVCQDRISRGPKGNPDTVRLMKTRKVFIDDAFRVMDTVGWRNFYRWLGRSPHAKELIVINVG